MQARVPPVPNLENLKVNDSIDWSSSKSCDPDVLIRYAMILCRAGHNEEALEMYRYAWEGMAFADGEKSDRFGKGWQNALKLNMKLSNFDKNIFQSHCYTLLGISVGSNCWYDSESHAYYVGDMGASRIQSAKNATNHNSDFAPAYILLGDGLDWTARFGKVKNLSKQYRDSSIDAYKKASTLPASAAIKLMIARRAN